MPAFAPYILLPGLVLRLEPELALPGAALYGLPALLLKGEGTGPPGGIRTLPALAGAVPVGAP